MPDNTLTAPETAMEDSYYEDEFGIGLKVFLLARLVFSGLCLFMVLGALVCVFTGLTDFDVLISAATKVGPSALDADGGVLFGPMQICMYVQGAYSVLSPVAVFLFMQKKNKLFAFVDTGLFVVFFAIAMVMGGTQLLFNGSAWFFYLILNPVWSFIALFAGKHFKYMPFM